MVTVSAGRTDLRIGRRTAVLASLAGIAFFAGCTKSQPAGDNNAAPAAPTEETLTVGGIMPLSGPLSIVGQAWTRGWELYWDKVNAEGGIQAGGKKYKVNFIAADSKFDAEAAATSAKKLVYKDSAKFIFGELTNASANAIQNVTTKEKVLNLVPWMATPAADGDVSAAKPYVVRPFISATDSMQMDYDYLRQQYPEVKKVAVTSWLGNEAVLERAVAVAKKNKYEVVAKESYALDSQDFVPFFTKVLAAKPDAIHLHSSPIAGFLLRAIRQLKFKGPVFSDSPLDPAVIRATAGADNATNVFCNGMDPFSPTDAMKDVAERWKKKYNEPFVSDAWLAWDTAWVLNQAITKAGSIDPKDVGAAFESMNQLGQVKTVFGDGMMSGKEIYGVDRVLAKPIPISRIDNGQIKLVKLTLPKTT
jgi:branched-chain amino acid transport system substrate-binding protein